MKKKSVDQLVAEFCTKWTNLGFRIDGTGLLVPTTKTATEAKLRTKASEFSTKAYDPKSKMFIAGVANAKEIDRMNEVLEPGGILVDAYVKNPVLLMYHDHRMALGQVSMIKPEDNGVHFEAWAGDPGAAPLTRNQEEGRSLIAQRVLKAVSVGFIPHKIRYPTYNDRGEMVDPAVIEQWEMLELSVVAVPCNAGALFDAKGAKVDGSPKKVWFFPTLGKDGRLSINQPKEAKQMDEELKELLTKLGVSLDSIASAINTIKDGQAALQKTLDSMGAAKGDKPAAEDDDEEEDEEDDDMKKALKEVQDQLAKAQADLAASNKRIEDLEATAKSIHDTVELLVKKFTGEQAA